MLFLSGGAVASVNALIISDSGANKISSFVTYFYSTFIQPFINLLKFTDVLGFPLFNWLFGLTIISLAIKFFRRLFSSGDDRK